MNADRRNLSNELPSQGHQPEDAAVGNSPEPQRLPRKPLYHANESDDDAYDGFAAKYARGNDGTRLI